MLRERSLRINKMHKRFKLHGNSCRSLKSCNCIAEEKSKVKYSKLGQCDANSLRTSIVINSTGKSIQSNDETTIEFQVNVKMQSKRRTWIAPICPLLQSGRRKSRRHNCWWCEMRRWPTMTNSSTSNQIEWGQILKRTVTRAESGNNRRE